MKANLLIDLKIQLTINYNNLLPEKVATLAYSFALKYFFSDCYNNINIILTIRKYILMQKYS